MQAHDQGDRQHKQDQIRQHVHHRRRDIQIALVEARPWSQAEYKACREGLAGEGDEEDESDC